MTPCLHAEILSNEFQNFMVYQPNSNEIHRNIYLYFRVLIELSVKSYRVFKVFSPNLSYTKQFLTLIVRT